MSRLSMPVFVSGVLFALARGLLALVAPLRFLGVLKFTGAGGAPVPDAPAGSPFAIAGTMIGASWGLLMALALVASLVGAWRGDRRGWRGLGAWWGVSALELVAGVGVTAVTFAMGTDHPVKALFTGGMAQDDVCCCLPVGVIWLGVLGVSLVSWVRGEPCANL